ncbi:hypothetical protein O3M35_006182 [Rhynocoris fuscipes]|uniref:Uncharacterized protein n=1 Tax=Rhynocoris fuscipes TaxID=488301 RepID=A0AAW1DCG2_9HEMI
MLNETGGKRCCKADEARSGRLADGIQLKELWQRILISSFAQPPDSASIFQLRRTYYHVKALARKINSIPETVIPHQYVSSYPVFPNTTLPNSNNNPLHSATPTNSICNHQPSTYPFVTASSSSTAFPSAPSSTSPVKQPVSQTESRRLPIVSESSYAHKPKKTTRKSSSKHLKASPSLRKQQNTSQAPSIKSSPFSSSPIHGHLQGRALNQSKPSFYPSVPDVAFHHSPFFRVYDDTVRSEFYTYVENELLL